MKQFYIFILTFLFTVALGAQVTINESDADTPGSDTAEFIELKGTPNAVLDGYVVVLYNGSNDTSYAAFDLDGKTFDANGFFILANAAIANATTDIILPDNTLQNGPDALAVYTGNDTDFPVGTPVTNVNLIDALVYGTADADDAELLAGLGETTQYDESLNGMSGSESLQLNSSGTYDTKLPTFRQENDAVVCPLTVAVSSVICDAITSGTDTYTTTFSFTGGGTATYQLTSSEGTISGDDPSTSETGSIIVSGVNEGVDFSLHVEGGLCDITRDVFAPTCVPDAALPFYESFNFAVGSDLGGQNEWVNQNAGSDIVVVESGNLTYAGLEAPVGNSIIFGGVGSDPQHTFTEQNTGEVFASFVMKVNDLSAATSTAGGYFFGFGESNTVFASSVWTLKDGDNYKLGLDKNTSTTNHVFTTTTYPINTNVFVVISYDFATHTSKLWVNPTQFGGATAPAFTLSTNTGTDRPTLGRVFIRQDSDAETPIMVLDEVRVGTTWASVTPQAAGVVENQIAGFAMFPNPANDVVYFVSKDNLTKNIQIFDVLGKEVLNKNVIDTLEINLPSGIYVVKTVENGATSVQKLVVE